jgi:hypothetical protein
VRNEVTQSREARRFERGLDVCGEARRSGALLQERVQPGARGQAYERVGAQGGQVERVCLGRRIVGRGDQHQLVGEQRGGDDIRRELGGCRAQREVDAVVGEVVQQHAHAAEPQPSSKEDALPGRETWAAGPRPL